MHSSTTRAWALILDMRKCTGPFFSPSIAEIRRLAMAGSGDVSASEELEVEGVEDGVGTLRVFFRRSSVDDFRRRR